jgi:hypothetical protein
VEGAAGDQRPVCVHLGGWLRWDEERGRRRGRRTLDLHLDCICLIQADGASADRTHIFGLRGFSFIILKAIMPALYHHFWALIQHAYHSIKSTCPRLGGAPRRMQQHKASRRGKLIPL